ncbi:hypothetical protein [Paracoccus liaowanqingii]|uniref:hypothetical protein n=1 Tax=Paracoccus liaowanqingii TaxID=2560053 RepID=UPI00143D342B|nr:hypothetical protein [Paracoccus liaowanqingii]
MRTKLLAAALMFSAAAFTNPALSYDRKQASSTEITPLSSQHPWTAGVCNHLAEFEARPGIKVNVTGLADGLNLDRADLAIRSEGSVAVVYMTLMDAAIYEQVSIDGVAPLTPYVTDAALNDTSYGYADFSPALLQSVSFLPGGAAAGQCAIPISVTIMSKFQVTSNSPLRSLHLTYGQHRRIVLVLSRSLRREPPPTARAL